MAHFNQHSFPQFSTISSDQLNALQLQNFTGTKKGTVSWGETCLICLQTLPSRTSRGGGENLIDIFARFCQLLEVPKIDIHIYNEWNSGGDPTRVFCRTCIGDVRGLINLHDQLTEIKNRIEVGVGNIKRTVKELNSKVPIADLKVINFRCKILQQCPSTFVSLVPNPNVYTTSSYQQQNSLSNLPDTSNHTSPHQNQVPSAFRVENYDTDHYKQGDDCVEFDNDFDYDAPSDQEDVNDSNDGYMPNLPTSSKPNPRKTKARQQYLALRSKRWRPGSRTVSSKEEFAPIITDAQGRMTYEGYVIQETRSGYICVECGAKCGKQNDTIALRKVKIHIKGHHLKAYQCPTCGKDFTSQDIVSQHITRVHENPPVNCDVCGKPLSSLSLLDHKFTHMNAEEKADFIEAGYKRRYVAATEARYACKICSRKFMTSVGRRMHERSHSTDIELISPFKCDRCDMRFKGRTNLIIHKARIHGIGVVRKKMCKICGILIGSGTSMAKHLMSHLKRCERPFPCKICGHRLSTLKTLKRHEAMHDGTEVYKAECDVCGKKFPTVKAKRDHRSRIHRHHPSIPQHLKGDVTIDKPTEGGYLEDLNNEGLQQLDDHLFSYQLYQLKRTPEGFQCCDCGTQMVGRGDHLEEQVKDHVKSTHLGNFVCNICTKRMKNIHEMDAHKRKEHLKEEVRACEICLKPNINKRWYYTHLRSHENPAAIAEAINNGALADYKTFRRMLKLEQVLSEMGEAPEYSCAICKGKFTTCKELYEHRKQEHPGTNKVQKNNPIPPEGPFICNYCGKELPTRKGLWYHRSSYHNRAKKCTIEVSSFNCSVCSAKYESLDGLILHRKCEHPEGLMSRPLDPRVLKKNKKTKETHFNCAICDLWYKTELKLETHQRTYHRRFMEMLHLTSRICPVCNTTFESLDEVYDHRKSKHPEERIPVVVRKKVPRTLVTFPEGSFGCSDCGKLYSSETSLSQHNRRVHRRKKGAILKVSNAETKEPSEKKKSNTESDSDDPSYSESATAKVVPATKRQTRSSETKRSQLNSSMSDLTVKAEMESGDSNNDLSDSNDEDLENDDDDLFSYQLYEFKRISKGFSCCTCGTELHGKGDDLEAQAKAHVKFIHLGKFECEICSKRMKTPGEVDIHKRKDHFNAKLYTCEVCKRPNLGRASHKIHVWTHKSPYDIETAINNGEFVVNKSFRTPQLRKVENMLTEMGEILSYSCAICNKRFRKLHTLFDHRRSDHPGTTRIPTAKKKQIVEGPFICNYCGKELPSRRSLWTHRSKYHNKSKKCDTGVSSFNCSVCSEKYENIDELIAHRMSQHPEISLTSQPLDPRTRNTNKQTDETPFNCSICDIWFKTEDGLDKHHRKYHRRFVEMLHVTSLTCPVCEEDFETLDEVYDHRKRKHPEDRIPATVKRRTRPPSPVGPPECIECGKQYSSRKTLLDHKRRLHYKKTGPKPKAAKAGTQKQMKKKKLETSDEESDSISESESDDPSYLESANVSPSKTRQTRVSQQARKRPRRKVLVVCESDNEDDVFETPYLDMEVKVEENSFEDDVINEEEINSFDYEIKDSPKSIYSDSD